MTVKQTIESFFSRYTKVSYKKGEIILRGGDPPSSAHFVHSGYIRIQYVNDIGNMLALHILQAGSVFPMPWIINETPNRYFYKAVTPVVLWRAPREDVRALFAKYPEVEEYMMSRMMHGFSGLMKRIEFLVFDSAYKKSVLLLMHFVKHFSDEKKNGRLVLPLTHREIASWIGTTRETASLQVEILKKKHLIEYDRRSLIIPSIERLEKELKSLDNVV